jgi:D-inositol-3-phosphate glycosyltransferase
VGGIPEVVVPGVSGELVPAHTPAAWAKALDEILGSPPRLAALRSSSRKFAAENFSLERQARSYAAVYSECAAECRRTALT